MLYSLFWFVLGAAMALSIRKLSHYNEERKMFAKIVAGHINLMNSFKAQLVSALNLKKQYLKETGLSDDEASNQVKNEKNIVDGWELISTAILINSIPKKYQKYFERK